MHQHPGSSGIGRMEIILFPVSLQRLVILALTQSHIRRDGKVFLIFKVDARPAPINEFYQGQCPIIVSLPVEGMHLQQAGILCILTFRIFFKNLGEGDGCICIILTAHVFPAQIEQRTGHLRITVIFTTHQVNIPFGVFNIASRKVDRGKSTQCFRNPIGIKVEVHCSIGCVNNFLSVFPKIRMILFI